MKKNNFAFSFLLQIIIMMTSNQVFAQKAAYLIFEKGGKTSSYEKLLQEAQKADIILFGELHNNPICHWLQLELTKDLHQTKKENLILGAEMFEADNQLVINEFTKNYIKESNFLKECKLWDNYATDYKPLVEFAKENKLSFVATNIPRRYAAMVAKDGLKALDKLENEAKNYIAPLPITVDLTLSGYANMLQMMGGGGAKGETFIYAQAVKDATMAYFINKNLAKDKNSDKNSAKTFLHYNGSYHSDDFQGIMWYLLKANPNLKILTISSTEQAQMQKIEDKNKDKGNFILITPESMTKTY